MNTKTLPASYEHIARRMLLIRGNKVMLDAELYGVSTKALNQAVNRRSTVIHDFRPMPSPSTVP
jgi:hypothetical protein